MSALQNFKYERRKPSEMLDSPLKRCAFTKNCVKNRRTGTRAGPTFFSSIAILTGLNLKVPSKQTTAAIAAVVLRSRVTLASGYARCFEVSRLPAKGNRLSQNLKFKLPAQSTTVAES